MRERRTPRRTVGLRVIGARPHAPLRVYLAAHTGVGPPAGASNSSYCCHGSAVAMWPSDAPRPGAGTGTLRRGAVLGSTADSDGHRHSTAAARAQEATPRSTHPWRWPEHPRSCRCRVVSTRHDRDDTRYSGRDAAAREPRIVFGSQVLGTSSARVGGAASDQGLDSKFQAARASREEKLGKTRKRRRGCPAGGVSEPPTDEEGGQARGQARQQGQHVPSPSPDRRRLLQ